MTIKRSILLTLFLWLSLGSYAQQVLRPWEGIRQKSRVRMWHYAPDSENTRGVGIIILPGGSYHHLGIRNEGHDVAARLSHEGYDAFVLRYSTGMYGNAYPVMMEDIQRAFMLVKENAAAYGINPHRVGVMGFSAGGHLAGWMGTYYDTNYLALYDLDPRLSLRPYFVAMIYPVVSMEDGLAHRKSRRNLLPAGHSPSLVRSLSLEKNVRNDMPPVFLVTCRDDHVVDPDNSIHYSRALREQDIPHRFVLYPEGGHGFGYSPDSGNETARVWMDEFLEWMENMN